MLQNTHKENSVQPTYFCNAEYNADLGRSSSLPSSLGRSVRAITTIAVGTFGLLTPHFLATHNTTSMWSNISAIQELNTENLDIQNNHIDQLKLIRKTTQVSVTELAQIFGVSRQAVHDWLNGASISEKNIVAIKSFDNVISIFLEADLTPSIYDLRRKVNGESILDSLSSNTVSTRLANMLVSTLQREHAQRIKLAERFKSRLHPHLQNEDFGSPHLNTEV